MYYCIFEPPVGPKEYERVAQIKSKLTELGIVGEMATPMPGKTIEQLVSNAVSKRYSTVVAIGGIALINQVVRAVEPYDLVLGIVPLTEHADITTLIGTSTWEAAADQLKRRRCQPVWLGEMNGGISFLTPARLVLPKKRLA